MISRVGDMIMPVFMKHLLYYIENRKLYSLKTPLMIILEKWYITTYCQSQRNSEARADAYGNQSMRLQKWGNEYGKHNLRH